MIVRAQNKAKKKKKKLSYIYYDKLVHGDVPSVVLSGV